MKKDLAGKKLMILGAGCFQVEAIRKAALLGCHVVTLDYLPDNIGHRFSRQAINCSTADQLAVLEHARRLKIDGIMTMASDVALPTVAFVGEELGLSTPSSETVAVMADKGNFRKMQMRNGLPHPAFTLSASAPDTDWSRFTGIEKLVAKPPRSSGSRGVFFFDKQVSPNRDRAIEMARNFSADGLVCIEEYIDGIDVTGEGFLFADGSMIIAFTEKFSCGCAVLGHRLPGLLTATQRKMAETEVAATLTQCGYAEGPFDVDLRVTATRVVILEMTPRLGGNGCPLLVGMHFGVDPVELTIRFALGNSPPVCLPGTVSKGCGSLVLGSEKSGVLKSMRTIAQIQQSVPCVIGGVLAVEPGMRVERFRHGGHALGVVILSCNSSKEYQMSAQKIRSEAAIHVVG